MKRTYYDVAVKLKEPVRGIHTYRYSGCHKTRYKMKGDNAKIWFYYPSGVVTTEEFSNVLSVEVKKYKRKYNK